MDASTLGNAIISAGCPIKSVSVGKANDRTTWKFEPADNVTQAQIDAGTNVIATIDPVVLSIIPFPEFISRWTLTEYSNLMKGRATAITNNSAAMSLVKNWDIAASTGLINLNAQAAQNFKASIVSAGILTQQRADVIFS